MENKPLEMLMLKNLRAGSGFMTMKIYKPTAQAF